MPTGLRVYLRSEHSVSWTFPRLFKPLMPELARHAVFDPALTEPSRPDDYSEETELFHSQQLENDHRRLDSLDMCPLPARAQKGVQRPRYFRPGFFPHFAGWLEGGCFLSYAAPYPDYAVLTSLNGRLFDSRLTPLKRRNCLANSHFRFLFANYDGTWWMMYSLDEESVASVSTWLRNKKHHVEDTEIEEFFHPGFGLF